MSEEQQSGEAADPGASRHGNFINYYQFHPAEERLRQLPRSIQQPQQRRKYVALDVGCNAGDLTLELHKFLSSRLPGCEVSILGIDLDPVLIGRARQKNDRPESVTFECLDFFADERQSVVSSYLRKHRVERFDCSYCFSITMWIHLNHGDAGLERFFLDLSACSEELLVEPQPWRCYRNAARRLRRANLADFPLFSQLQARGDVQQHIQNILTDKCGFGVLEVTEENDWQRRLLLFQRIRH